MDNNLFNEGLEKFLGYVAISWVIGFVVFITGAALLGAVSCFQEVIHSTIGG